MNKIYNGFTNQEQAEAYNENIKKEHVETAQKLGPEVEKQHDAVLRATQILADAQVPCFLFPYIKYKENFPKACLQHNTFVSCSELWDESGQLKGTAHERHQTVINSALMSMFSTIIGCTPQLATLPAEARMNGFIQFMYFALNSENKRITDFQNNA
jgi:hypothetical protein